MVDYIQTVVPNLSVSVMWPRQHSVCLGDKAFYYYFCLSVKDNLKLIVVFHA